MKCMGVPISDVDAPKEKHCENITGLVSFVWVEICIISNNHL